MRRIAAALLVTTAALAGGATSANASATFGISDQMASTFTNPLYKPLKLKAARYVAPYDVISDPLQSVKFAQWYAAAKKAHQTILVSFEHSRVGGKQQQAPTVGQYSTAMKAFHKKYRSIKQVNTWNEVDRCQKGSATEGQPKAICSAKKGPKLLQSYYTVDRKVFKGDTIIPLDVLDQNNVGAAVNYVRAFKKIAKPTPKIWGIHNYSDTNRLSSTRTKRLIKEIGKKGDIWLLETGGQLKLGSSVPGPAKAAKALECMFNIVKHNSRIKKAFIYQFNGDYPTAPFDAGLISVTNQIRPGYTIVKKRKAGVSACAK